MLAGFLLAVGTIGMSSTALANPVLPDTAISPLPTYTNFSSSCESIALYATQAIHRLPDQLKARCRDNAGVLHSAEIDLNLCVGINYQNASLLWSIYGKFSEYCSSCWSAGTRVEFGCACRLLTGNATKISTNSTLDLDTGIGNVNGTLHCAGGIGSRGD
ncbi:hypothetical protein F503_04690 [Ophiostoma piceae UAMH 11346]|uniref:Cyanovirin-N domain-containing protein n=1 Tax=Ophiostoma piceae (strain UAMH 11346) TaxID=1262450 RepID=S3CU09_OPHP1|nr:hypothetical protein F503_04690 [Ophiostoma piceae UAMH 11346]